MQSMDDESTVYQFDIKAAPARDRGCDEILLLSKTVPKGQGFVSIGAVDPDRCPCQCRSRNLNRVIDVYHLDHTFGWHWPIEALEPCDELSSANVMKGCYLTGRGRMKLRRHRCERGEHLVGCEEANILIYRPAGAGWAPVFSGRLTGTVGLEPHASGAARCCSPNHHEGSIQAWGVGGMQDCSLCATYQGTFSSLDADRVCDGVKIDYTGQTDGIVCCPCPEHEDKKDY